MAKSQTGSTGACRSTEPRVQVWPAGPRTAGHRGFPDGGTATGTLKVVRSLETGSSGDRRGWRVDLLQACGLGSGRIGDLHVVTLEAGACRGNHFHPETDEWLLVFGGPAVLAWREPGSNEVKRVPIEGEGPWLFEIPAGVEHALQNRSTRKIYLVALRAAGRQETLRCGPLLVDLLKNTECKEKTP